MAEIKIAPAKVEQKKVETPAKVEFKKAEQFAILSERFNLLVTKREQLEKFLIADDGTNGANLLFKNGNKTFEIANSAVIKEVLTFAKNKLNVLIEITDSEILSFEI